jgi:glycosyltransferase involved in cell wall biosynthesis
MRGGEKVLLHLARLFPEAPIFTLLHVKGSVDAELEDREIHTTFVNHLPDLEARYRHYLPLFPVAAATIDLRGFDLVVSSSHCVVKGVRPAPGACHVSYCHTPMRYVWDRYDDYFGPGRLSGLARLVVPVAAEGLRAWDVASSSRVHRFAANSAFVAGRIRRFYGRSADVIPPPVDTGFFTPGADVPGRFDLVVSALAPYKRLELVMDAYRGTRRPVTIVGSGPDEARLRRVAPAEVTLAGRVSDERLRELYRSCRALLLPGVEDFGIAPLEAMACGRPAVVFGEGGGLETVVDGRTGLVFQEPTAASLRAAIDRLETVGFNRETLRSQAEAHGPAVFSSRFSDFVERALNEHEKNRSDAGGGGRAAARQGAHGEA